VNGNLHIVHRRRAAPVDLDCLRRFIRCLLRDALHEEDFDLGICLVGAKEMARLNETFLRHQGPTDVITFDYADKAGRASRLSRCPLGPDGRDARPALYGEIVICVDRAVVQARRFRTSWQSELARYLIHGVLHLRGFDDRRPAGRRRMKREEDRLLRQLGRRFALSTLAGDGRSRRACAIVNHNS
jgi:probable rRNA maturation factor